MSASALSVFNEQFGREPAVLAYAPGRLEFIGNHTDYNGGPVIGVAVDMGVTSAVARRDDEKIILFSNELNGRCELSVSAITKAIGQQSWANYVLGVFGELVAAGMKADTGFELAIKSTLPVGSGMSSSAAVELSTAYALSDLYGFEIERLELARLCRRAENNFVGMPCGLLDQAISSFGSPEKLVKLDCHTEAVSELPMPQGVRFHIFDTTKKHALIDSLYSERYNECLVAFDVLRDSYSTLECLAQATPEMLFAARDILTESQYMRALHVVEESWRVEQVEKALAEGDMSRVGELLEASHDSSRSLFENSSVELDCIVDALRGEKGVYGCRLTGGGFGGAVMAVTDEGFAPAQVKRVCDAYWAQFKALPVHMECAAGRGARVLPLKV